MQTAVQKCPKTRAQNLKKENEISWGGRREKEKRFASCGEEELGNRVRMAAPLMQAIYLPQKAPDTRELGAGNVLEKHWPRVPREVLDAPPLDMLQVRLVKALGSLIW